MHSCIDGIGVSWPNCCAKIWSSEMPACTSDPCVCLRMRLGEEHRARAEVIAADFRRRERLGVAHVGVADDGERSRGTARAGCRLARRTDRSACRSAAGDHRFFCSADRALPAEPCTISMATKRSFCPSARLARTIVRAGTIASSSGSAIVTPMPFSTVRREMCLLVMNIRSPLPCAGLSRPLRLARRPSVKRWSSGFAHPERGAVDDAEDERRDAVVVLRRVADDRANRRHVGVLDAPARARRSSGSR